MIRMHLRQGEAGLERLDGSPPPVLRVGATVELLASATALSDPEEAQALLAPEKHVILPENTRLLAGVRSDVQGGTVLRGSSDLQVIGWDGALVELRTLEPLVLEYLGGRSSLRPCTCSVPSMPGFESRSINHAFTKISEKFETSRLSHTGNVFERVFYHDTERSAWVPLGGFRLRR